MFKKLSILFYIKQDISWDIIACSNIFTNITSVIFPDVLKE